MFQQSRSLTEQAEPDGGDVAERMIQMQTYGEFLSTFAYRLVFKLKVKADLVKLIEQKFVGQAQSVL